MNALVKQSELAQTPAPVVPEYTVEATYPTAKVTIDLDDRTTLVYSVDFDTEVDSARIYSDDAECLVMTVHVKDNCTMTAYDEDGGVVYESVVKTPDWIHTDAVVEIEEAVTACEY